MTRVTRYATTYKEADPSLSNRDHIVHYERKSFQLCLVPARHGPVNSSTIFKQGLAGADACTRVHRANLVQSLPTQRMFFTVSTNLPAVPLLP